MDVMPLRYGQGFSLLLPLGISFYLEIAGDID